RQRRAAPLPRRWRRRFCLEALEDRTLLSVAPFEAAIPLTPGVSVQGRIDQPGEADVYQVTLEDTVRLQTRVTPEADSGLELRLSWYNTEGGLLIQSDGTSLSDPANNLQQYLIPGTYYVKIEGLTPQTGTYQLTTTAIPSIAFGFN